MLDMKLDYESNLVAALYKKVVDCNYVLEADKSGIYLTPFNMQGFERVLGRRITYYTCGDLVDTPVNQEELRRLQDIANKVD